MNNESVRKEVRKELRNLANLLYFVTSSRYVQEKKKIRKKFNLNWIEYVEMMKARFTLICDIGTTEEKFWSRIFLFNLMGHKQEMKKWVINNHLDDFKFLSY